MSNQTGATPAVPSARQGLQCILTRPRDPELEDASWVSWLLRPRFRVAAQGSFCNHMSLRSTSMTKRVTLVALVFGFVAGIAAPLEAQVYTPTYMAPNSGGDLGIYLSDGPGDFAIEGIWRRNFGGYDLGFRAGIADRDDASLLLGAELRNPLSVTGAPLDFAFTAGLQALVSDDTRAGFQAGVTIGKSFVPGDFTVTPYIHPRAGLVSGLRRDDDLEATLLADIGFDFAFQPNLSFRIGLGLGDETAGWGVGLAWR